VNERTTITGLHPKRADIILAGACIVKAILDLYHVDTLFVSDHGLRHGIILDRFERRGAQ
jgi:exopolyphosphatase/guanosine-5'-triphosphate,3'-diphosphate pyrophosphatase